MAWREKKDPEGKKKNNIRQETPRFHKKFQLKVK